jgi:aminocarboxymuconate-semialdehyde decarboxylase
MYIYGDERLTGYDLLDAVGRLTDTTFAIARLFFSGQLTRFPGVTLVVSHGGGLALRARPDAAQPGDPCRVSARRLSAALFRHRVVRSEGVAFLCDVAGADKVVLGSDYPFPIGGLERWRIVDKTSQTEPERRAILGEPTPVSIDCGCCGDR